MNERIQKLKSQWKDVTMMRIWSVMCLPFAVVALILYAVVVAIMYLDVYTGIRVFKEQFRS